MAFKDPSFQNRVASAGNAKQKALDQLKAKPPVDEIEMRAQREAWEAGQRDIADKRGAKNEANAAAKAEKASKKAADQAAAEQAVALKAARLTPTSAADMKAVRDARYAARKNRTWRFLCFRGSGTGHFFEGD